MCLIVIIVLMCATAVIGNDLGNTYKILLPGVFDRSNIGSIDSLGWYGLFKTDSGHVLESVEIRTKSCPAPYSSQPGDTTGVSITVDHPLKPLFLVQCPREFEPGLVTTHFSGDKWINPGQLIMLGECGLSAFGQLTDEGFRSPREPLVLDYQVKLFKYPLWYGQRQVLVEHDRACAEDTPSIIWAGDLDRDGQVDLFLDILNHYAGRHYALYLSCEADAGDLVKLVADLFIHGC